MEPLHFYFDFISPYAYLAAERIEALAARHQREVVWHPILLAAILNHNQQRGPAEIPDKRRYSFSHLLRLAHDENLVLVPPPGHPFNSLLPLRIAALRPEAELILHLYRACWRDGQAVDSEGSLKSLMDEDTLKRASSPEAKERLKNNTQQAIELGVFGVPTVVVDGELFWGFDSFAHLERFLRGQDPVDPKLTQIWENLPTSASRI